MKKIWRPTDAQVNMIRQYAADCVGLKPLKVLLKVVENIGPGGIDKNILSISDCDNFNDMQAYSFVSWEEFRNSYVNLTECGSAAIDVHIHKREGKDFINRMTLFVERKGNKSVLVGATTANCESLEV